MIEDMNQDFKYFILPFKFIAHINGKDLWSTEIFDVKLRSAVLGYYEGDDYGELRVFFSKLSKNTKLKGLIYTDPLFLLEIKSHFKSLGFSDAAIEEISYSGQGMLRREFVSFDIAIEEISYSGQGPLGREFVSFDIGEIFMHEFIIKSTERG